MKRVFVDTEFLERRVMEYLGGGVRGAPFLVLRKDVPTLDLISVGVVITNEAGDVQHRYYAESTEVPPGLYDLEEARWVRENVRPKLTPETSAVQRAAIRKEMTSALGNPKSTGETIRFYGWYCAHDLVILEQIMGGMAAWPDGWPMYMRDLRDLCDMYGMRPPPELPAARAHHALNDAEWTLDVWRALRAQGHDC